MIIVRTNGFVRLRFVAANYRWRAHFGAKPATRRKAKSFGTNIDTITM